MEIPLIGHRQFWLLAGLRDGRPRNPAEIRKALGGWRYGTAQLAMLLTRMRKQGFVSKRETIRRRPDGSTYRDRFTYRITPDGRRAYRECLDWYLNLAEWFSQPLDETDPVIGARRAG